jgi:hypothetical protein
MMPKETPVYKPKETPVETPEYDEACRREWTMKSRER